MRNEDEKIKFEYILEKKCKELEQLGDALVVKEKEVLIRYKEKLEVSKLDKKMLEKTALLEETDSEEDEDEIYARGMSVMILTNLLIIFSVV